MERCKRGQQPRAPLPPAFMARGCGPGAEAPEEASSGRRSSSTSAGDRGRRLNNLIGGGGEGRSSRRGRAPGGQGGASAAQRPRLADGVSAPRASWGGAGEGGARGRTFVIGGRGSRRELRNEV